VQFLKCCSIVIIAFSLQQLHAQSDIVPNGARASSKPALTSASAPKNGGRESSAQNNGAPVKIVEFFDYQCPFCNATLPALQTALKNNSEQIQFILKHDPLPIHPDSMLAHEAALAAGEQGKFWEMDALLFAHQQKLKFPDLLEYGRQLHLDMAVFEERLKSHHYKPAIEQDIALAKALGVDGTPTFFINGQQLSGAQTAENLESAIAGRSPARANDNAAAIARLNLSQSPVRGPADAPVTIVEFSDFQCPFCARAVSTLVELRKQYAGQIKWVFKNYPLTFHPDSQLAHRAALAAGQQGKFWEMHDLVFSTQNALKRNDLMEKAQTLNLDMVKFAADLESKEIANQIEADQKEGDSLHVNGTPTFYIDGKEYTGALPLETFKAAIDRELAANHVAVPIIPDLQPELSFGPANAPITLVWYSDLESDLSLKATLTVKHIMNMHPGKVRLIYKNRPLQSHPNSMLLHEVAMAANAQGKFWPMHDLIVANAANTSREYLLSYARQLGLDMKRFDSDLQTHKYRSRIEHDLQEASQRSVQGTPVFFLNSTRLDGLQPEKRFDDLIAFELNGHLQASSR